MNEIKLDFYSDIRKVAGYEFGLKVYEQQLKNKINYKDINIIIFPSHIDGVSISFVKGITDPIFKNINIDEFTRYFIIKGRDKVVNKFLKSIYF